MQSKDSPYLREELLDMPTPQLRQLLYEAAQAEEPDEALVRLLADVLEQQDSQNRKEIPFDADDAWAQYISSKTADTGRQKKKHRNLLVRIVAAAAAACILIFAVPRVTQANNFFEMIARWTENLFELFTSEHDRGGKVEYVFQTDNEGLQQLYDAVVQMGVTEPVVPMWLPAECRLIEIKDMSAPKRARLFARFTNSNGEVTITVDLYSTGTAYNIQKDEEKYGDYEYNGVVHQIVKNEDAWIVTWSQNAMVAYMTITCPEDTLYRIIDSIYTMEAG